MNAFIFTVAAALAITAEWTPDPSCPYPSEHVTKYPYYGNCSIYWACYEGNKFLMECPEGLEFDVNAQTCSPPEIANCDPYFPTSARPTDSTTSTESTTNGDTSTTSLSTTPTPSPTTSSPFTTSTEATTTSEGSSTSNGETSTTSSTLPPSTPSPTTPSPSTASTEATTTSKGSSTTAGPYPQCPYPSDDVIYFPFVGDCAKYWECFEGVSYLYSCPGGLWWHQELRDCDYPGDYCDNSTVTTTTATKTPVITTPVTPTPVITTTSSSDIDCPPSSEILYYPYPGDCTKYWECFQGKKYLYQCAAGLWWHQEIKDCDYPGNYCDDGK